MVESIEAVEPELKAKSLTNLPCFVERQIEVDLFGSRTIALRRVADGPELVTNQGEGRRIEDLFSLLACVAGDAGLHEAPRIDVARPVARAVCVGNVVVCRVAARDQSAIRSHAVILILQGWSVEIGQGVARKCLEDRRKLPPSQRFSLEGIGTSELREEEDRVGHEHLRPVNRGITTVRVDVVGIGLGMSSESAPGRVPFVHVGNRVRPRVSSLDDRSIAQTATGQNLERVVAGRSGVTKLVDPAEIGRGPAYCRATPRGAEETTYCSTLKRFLDAFLRV